MANKIKVTVPGYGDIEIQGVASEATMNKLLEVLEEKLDKSVAAGKAADELKKQSENLNDNLKDVNEKLQDQNDTLEDMARKRMNELSNMQKLGKASAKTSKQLKDLTLETSNLALGIDDSIDSFSSVTDFTANKLQNFGKTIAEAAKNSAVFSGATALVVRGIGAMVSAFAIAGGAVIGFAVGQLQNLVETFKDLSAAGAVFAGGFREIKDLQLAQNLTLEEFNRVIQNSTENLITFGGSVAEGARQLSQVNSRVVRQFGNQLYNLGISFEEAAEITADLMAQQQLAGMRQTMSTQQQAEAAIGYIKELKMLSALTGQSVRELKDKQRADMLDASLAGKFAQMEQNGFVNIRKQFGLAARDIETKFGEQGLQLLKEVFANGGIVTAEMARFASGMPGLMRVIQQFSGSIQDSNNANLEGADAMKLWMAPLAANRDIIQQNVRDLSEFGRMLQLNPNNQALQDMAGNLGIMQQGLAKIPKTGAEVDKFLNEFAQSLKEANDIAKAQEELRKFQIAVDRATTALLPLSISAVDWTGKFFKNLNLIMDDSVTWDMIGEAVGSVLKRIPDNMWNYITKSLPASYAAFGDFLNGMWNQIGEDLDRLFSLEEKFKSLENIIDNGIASTQEGLSRFFDRLGFSGLAEYVRNFDQTVMNFIDDFTDNVSKIANADLSDVIKVLPKSIGIVFNRFTEGLQNIDKIIEEKAIEFTDWVFKSFKDIFTDLFEKLKGILPDFGAGGNFNPLNWFDDKKEEEGRRLGGVGTYPTTGGFEVLHGTEAVIPLPSGDAIPVTISAPKMRPLEIKIDGSDISLKDDIAQLSSSFKDVMDAQSTSTTTVVTENNQTNEQIRRMMEKQLEATEKLNTSISQVGTTLDSQLRVLRDVAINL